MAEPLILKNGSNIVNNFTITSGFSTSSSGIGTTTKVGIGTEIPTADLTVIGNTDISGIVTATGGFISAASTTPIQITLIGNQLTFTATGIGSTTFTVS